MVAIKGMEMQTDCKKCPLMGTDGSPKDSFKPMMCIAIWATTHEIKHCVGGKIRDDCPLVEIGTCKDCKYYTVYEIEYFQTNQKEQFSYCEKYERLGNNHLSPDFYCGNFKKRGNENE